MQFVVVAKVLNGKSQGYVVTTACKHCDHVSCKNYNIFYEEEGELDDLGDGIEFIEYLDFEFPYD